MKDMEYQEKQERELLYKAAIEKWGDKAQLEMAQEEAIELALAIRKFIRNFNQKRADDLCSEIADNEIMNEQINFMYPNFRAKIEEIKIKKLKRLRKRIDNNQFN